MAICKNCGADLPDDVKFCTSCGQPLETQQTFENTAPNYQQTPYTQPISNDTYVPQKTNGLAIAGFVVSLVSLVLCCCGIGAIVSLVLSIVGYVKASKENQKGKGLALAGIIISAIVVALWLTSQILVRTNVVDITNYYSDMPDWLVDALEQANY